MQPYYLIVQTENAMPTKQYDLRNGQSLSVPEVSAAIAWVMNSESAAPLQSVQFWLSDGEDTYLLERNSLLSAVSECICDPDVSCELWKRRVMMINAQQALTHFRDWVFAPNIPTAPVLPLEQLSELLLQAKKFVCNVLDSTAIKRQLDDHGIGFFRNYETLEHLRLQSDNAQRCVAQAQRSILDNETLQNDLEAVLHMRQQVSERQNEIDHLILKQHVLYQQRQAQVRESGETASTLDKEIVKLQQQRNAVEQEIADQRRLADDLLQGYRLSQVPVERCQDRVNHTLTRQRYELHQRKQRQRQAQRCHDTYHRWFRLHCEWRRLTTLCQHKDNSHV